MNQSAVPASLLLMVIGAALARVWMQASALPPYAGLDEIYHAARLSFVAQEGRNPGMREASIPRYLKRSIDGDPSALPAFGVIGARWPKVANSRKILPREKELTTSDITPYTQTNYEAQQPSLYYSLAAPLVHLLPHRTPLQELRLWRAFSAVCAVIIIAATAITASRFHGSSGAIVAVLLLSMPTWQTLIVRAGNDALACAFIAVAYAVTFAGSNRARWWVLEAVIWALAVATKLYSWPAVVILPLVWHVQHAPRTRRWLVSVCGALSVLITIFDLASRTNNPLGLFAFDVSSVIANVTSVPVDYAAMARIIIATAAWTSGQHWNALTPLAILLYLGPVALVTATWIVRRRAESKVLLAACAMTITSFALAQAINAGGYIRQAHSAGLSLPAGGKEGWYWYALAPLLVCAIFGLPARYAQSWLVAGMVVWLAGWDILVNEGALFQDFAGTTSPTGGGLLFRWGPRSLPFTADLTLVGVGPGASWLTLLRVAELVLVAAITVVALRNRERAV